MPTTTPSRRLRFGPPLALLLALALPACGARAVAAAANLAISGWPGPPAEAEALLSGALRAPRDSVARVAALGRLAARLQEGGWLEARVAARRDTAAGVLEVTVTPGPRYRWQSFAIDASPADSAAFAASLDWSRDGPVGPGALGAAIQRAVTEAEGAGYAWATLGVSVWDADSGRVRARLSGTRGPRVIVEQVRIEGLVVTRPDVAEAAVGRLKGLAYNPASARLATQRLEQLGVFRRVDYLGVAGRGDWRQGVLRWRVEEPHYNTFEGAVGVQGSAGAVGLARLELGNLLGTARSIALAWQSRGPGLTDFAARYVEPMLFGRALRVEGMLQQQIQDTLYTRFTWGASGRVALGERLRAEAGFQEEAVVQPQNPVRDANTQNTSFTLERDGRDDARDPRTGTREKLVATQAFTHETLQPGPSLPTTGRDLTGSALQFEGDWHRRISRRSGFAIESRAAERFSTDRVLGDWQRWPVGGAASLRGHVEDEYHVDRYALARMEWRWFLGFPGQRAVLFWDHAHMETRLALPAGGDRQDVVEADGFGVGLRMPAAGGDVDIDYGIAPGHGVLEGKIHLRLVTVF